MFRFLLLATFLAALPISAATYVVESDRGLIARAEAIVTGTVTSTHAELLEGGLVRTIAEVRVAEDFRCNAGATVSVTVWGGRVGNTWMHQSGAPRFAEGEEVLLLLDRDDASGLWTTTDLALGKFSLRRDALGEAFYARTEEIHGWDEMGERHVEHARPATEFLESVRDVLAGRSPRAPREVISRGDAETHGTYTARQYVITYQPGVYARRTGSKLTVGWHLIGTTPGYDYPALVDSMNATWNAATSNVVQYSRSTTAAAGTSHGPDGEHRVIANDPNNAVAGSCCPGVAATAFEYCSGPECDFYTYNGEEFAPITESDIVINNGINPETIPPSDLQTTLWHEAGHTLGLRHSDFNSSDSAVCAEPLPCSSIAVMKGVIVRGLTALQTWDQQAAKCVFNGLCDTTPPTCPVEQWPALTQPSDQTVMALSGTTLSVTATGPGPLQYRWYQGLAPDTSNPVGGNAPTLDTGALTSTTKYWVLVTNTCGQTPSGTITVNVVAGRRRASG